MRITSAGQQVPFLEEEPRFKRLNVKICVEFDEAVTQEEATAIVLAKLHGVETPEAECGKISTKVEEIPTETKKELKKANTKPQEKKQEKTGGKRTLNISKEDLQSRIDAGMTVAQIAEQERFTARSIYNLMKKYGITPRKAQSPRF